MRTTCSLVVAVWFLAGISLAQETAPSTRDPEAARQLFDLPEASAEEYAQVEGTWELVQDTSQAGTLRRVKTHRGGKTTVTAYDAEGDIVGQHSSEYKLKKSGMARIFVFFRIVPATGPSKGHEFPGPFYYSYNVQDNKFIEVYGLLAGDDRSPRVLLWNRLDK
jgi:YD repeat-containing protein